jgi:ABC-type multidrug transport system fused ATPase/permease subunit
VSLEEKVRLKCLCSAITSTRSWKIAPPVTDFIGAMIVFMTVDWRMAVALALFVALMATGLVLFSAKRPCSAPGVCRARRLYPSRSGFRQQVAMNW